MAQWIDFLQQRASFGALLYLTPADYFEDRKESRLQNEEKKFIMQISTEKLIGCNSSRLKPSYKLSYKSPSSLWAGQTVNNAPFIISSV